MPADMYLKWLTKNKGRQNPSLSLLFESLTMARLKVLLYVPLQKRLFCDHYFANLDKWVFVWYLNTWLIWNDLFRHQSWNCLALFENFNSSSDVFSFDIIQNTFPLLPSHQSNSVKINKEGTIASLYTKVMVATVTIFFEWFCHELQVELLFQDVLFCLEGYCFEFLYICVNCHYKSFRVQS